MAVVGPYVRMTLLIADELENAALRQPIPDGSRIVFVIHVDEFENLAAEVQGHMVVEGHDGVHRMKIFKHLFAFRKTLAPRLNQVRLPTLPVLRHSLMHDHHRRRSKERRAAEVITVVLRDDDIAHRLLGDGLNVFQYIARDRKSTRLNSSHSPISY